MKLYNLNFIKLTKIQTELLKCISKNKKQIDGSKHKKY